MPGLAKGREGERASSYFNGGSETLFTRVEREETINGIPAPPMPPTDMQKTSPLLVLAQSWMESLKFDDLERGTANWTLCPIMHFVVVSL